MDITMKPRIGAIVLSKRGLEENLAGEFGTRVFIQAPLLWHITRSISRGARPSWT